MITTSRNVLNHILQNFILTSVFRV